MVIEYYIAIILHDQVVVRTPPRRVLTIVILLFEGSTPRVGAAPRRPASERFRFGVFPRRSDPAASHVWVAPLPGGHAASRVRAVPRRPASERFRVDHVFSLNEHNIEHSLRRKKQRVGHSFLWKEHTFDPSLRGDCLSEEEYRLFVLPISPFTFKKGKSCPCFVLGVSPFEVLTACFTYVVRRCRCFSLFWAYIDFTLTRGKCGPFMFLAFLLSRYFVCFAYLARCCRSSLF